VDVAEGVGAGPEEDVERNEANVLVAGEAEVERLGGEDSSVFGVDSGALKENSVPPADDAPKPAKPPNRLEGGSLKLN
jgi:hypothetical protein